MKKIIQLSLLLLLNNAIFSQKAISFSEVIKVDSTASNKELFYRALFWFAEYYDNSSSVIQLKDEVNFQIIGKSSFLYETNSKYGNLVNGIIKYTIKIYCKDGRYKFEICNFWHQSNFTNDTYDLGLITESRTCPKDIKLVLFENDVQKNGIWEQVQQHIYTDSKSLIDSLKNGVLKKAVTKEDNW